MRKLIIAAVTFLFFISCQTGPVVWDNAYPEEKVATVQFYGMNIDSFNGISVSKFNWIKIPAGQAIMGGDVTISHGGVSFYARGMEFTCMFEEGKAYKVYGSTDNNRWGVKVYENDEFVVFVPFKEQPVFTR